MAGVQRTDVDEFLERFLARLSERMQVAIEIDVYWLRLSMAHSALEA